jgi:hypothetical protein
VVREFTKKPLYPCRADFQEPQEAPFVGDEVGPRLAQTEGFPVKQIVSGLP